MSTRIDRARQAAMNAELDRLYREYTGVTTPTIAVTVASSSYPTVAQSYFTVKSASLSGNDSEGSPINLSVDDLSPPYWAANMGTAVPPPGTYVILFAVDEGRWSFRYDG